jgi:hypothetical protein
LLFRTDALHSAYARRLFADSWPSSLSGENLLEKNEDIIDNREEADKVPVFLDDDRSIVAI